MKFRKLLEDFSTAVMITGEQESHFRARPMVIAGVEENCDLWFITDADSTKVHEIEADTRVHTICQNGPTNCISIAGRASLSRNRAKIRELWKPPYRVWLPVGPGDPNIVLIRVAGEHGEYRDNTGLCLSSYQTWGHGNHAQDQRGRATWTRGPGRESID